MLQGLFLKCRWMDGWPVLLNSNESFIENDMPCILEIIVVAVRWLIVLLNTQVEKPCGSWQMKSLFASEHHFVLKDGDV